MNRANPFAHPKPVPADRIFLTARWQYLAMLNYEVDSNLLATLVPEGTELDDWNGKVFISLVGFQFLETRLLGCLPVPFHANFEEINLRFYVRRRAGGEVRRGVVFIREIVPRRAIAFAARAFYNENYTALPMDHEINSAGNGRVRVSYRWRSDERWNKISLETDGSPELPADGSIEQFITEHYWGYAAQRSGGCVEYRVTHPSWRVWQVRQAALEGEVEKLYGRGFALALRGDPHSAFLAEGSAVAVMRGRRL